MVNDFGSERSGLLFTFTAGDLPEKTFAVAEFSLQEELSELFTLSLTLVSKRADIDLGSLLLQSVKFQVIFNGVEQRQVSGIIAQAVLGDSHTHRTIYYLTVRPALWRMNLSGGSGAYLHNEFSFISGYKDWRALYRYKPLADGDEVATVVGPAGEEIYVNEDGCIRIHFHWDRYDKADENASCWVRFA
nr:contractile injection system protein, VgrG/Pvc8 family [Photorhabdus tasmaniensis]